MNEAIYKRSFELFLSHTNEKKVIEQILKKTINLNRVRSVLDIGGGNGLIADFFARHNLDILVIEPNKNFVSILRRKGFRVIETKWENTEIKENFDLIIAAYVVTNFPSYQISKLLNKMLSCLNEGGYLVILAVDEQKGSWREIHTYFYDLIGLKKVSSTIELKKQMKTLNAEQKTFITKVYANNEEEMLQILSFDFYKYGEEFKRNKAKLKQYLNQFVLQGKIELEIIHYMFIYQK